MKNALLMVHTQFHVRKRNRGCTIPCLVGICCTWCSTWAIVYSSRINCDTEICVRIRYNHLVFIPTPLSWMHQRVGSCSLYIFMAFPVNGGPWMLVGWLIRVPAFWDHFSGTRLSKQDTAIQLEPDSAATPLLSTIVFLPPRPKALWRISKFSHFT